MHRSRISTSPAAHLFLRLLLLGALVGSANLSTACGSDPKGPAILKAGGSDSPTDSSPPSLFEERAAEVGLDFVHGNGMAGELTILEIMGSGAALFDYDGDGDLDVYLLQGHSLAPEHRPPNGGLPPSRPGNRLFRNELIGAGSRSGGELRFTDVTAEAGMAGPAANAGYGMGAAVADVDDDGDLDLYVTNYGPDQLWLNLGDGTFRDATTPALAESRWSTAAVFFDRDLDGDLDLFVGGFLQFSLDRQLRCAADGNVPDYCNPTVYDSAPDRLLDGRGDGSFVDITPEAGLDATFGNALGAVAADFNGDRWPDLYVANDGMANQLWINRGDGSFRDEALLGGAAFNRAGRPEASMGVDTQDLDGDGDLDLFMTHLTNESNTLYLNDGGALFEDRSLELGLAAPSLPYTSFGTLFFDLDRDGWLDLLVVNGEVRKIRAQAAAGDSLPLKQPNQLFRNLGPPGLRFEDITSRGGPSFEALEVSRGAAFGDLDNDGDEDVVVTTNNGPVRLLVNRLESQPEGRRHWLGLELIDPLGPTPPVGALLEVVNAEGPRLRRRLRTDGSYLSVNDPRLILGLGDNPGPVDVRVSWPPRRAPGAQGRAQATVETFSALTVDQYHQLRRGGGSLPGS